MSEDNNVCKCLKEGKCQEKCRHYIEYDEDCNCVLVTVHNSGSLTLKETGERLGLSYARIKQIQDKAQEKLKKSYIKDFS